MTNNEGFSKIILLSLLGVLFLTIGIGWYSLNNQPTTQGKTPLLPIGKVVPITKVTEQTTNLVTHMDVTYGFSFQYPNDFVLSSSETPFYFLKTPLITIINSHGFYDTPHYHQEAIFTVSVENGTTTSCYKNPLDQKMMGDSQEINGVKYMIGTTQSAAAGTSYTTTIYRTLRDTQCFELALSLKISSDGNDIDTTKRDASKNSATEQLQIIVTTMKFSK